MARLPAIGKSRCQPWYVFQKLGKSCALVSSLHRIAVPATSLNCSGRSAGGSVGSSGSPGRMIGRSASGTGSPVFAVESAAIAAAASAHDGLGAMARNAARLPSSSRSKSLKTMGSASIRAFSRLTRATTCSVVVPRWYVASRCATQAAQRDTLRSSAAVTSWKRESSRLAVGPTTLSSHMRSTDCG